jgi:hypothetical protein
MTTKMRFAGALLGAVVVLCAPVPITAAPEGSGQDSKPTILPMVPVRVDVVFTRFQGEKKLSSLPFSLLANATDPRDRANPVSIRMGVDVPVGTSTTTENQTTPSGNTGVTHSTGTTRTNVQYRSVGTDIDCQVTRPDENRFSVRVSVSDSSIYARDGDTSKTLGDAAPAAFRTFSTANTVVMHDGQTVLFGVGTDKISGETLKVEVTLHVVK